MRGLRGPTPASRGPIRRPAGASNDATLDPCRAARGIALLIPSTLLRRRAGNLLEDPSFEMTKDKDRRSPSVKSIANFEDENPVLGGRRRRGPRARGAQGAADRPVVRRAWIGPRTGSATTSSRPSSIPPPRCRWTSRRDPRYRHPGLLDPGQLRDGRAAGAEHADHPREATLRGREGAAGPDARPGQDHAAGLRHRRQAGRVAAAGQHPAGARRSAARVGFAGCMPSTSARAPAR